MAAYVPTAGLSSLTVLTKTAFDAEVNKVLTAANLVVGAQFDTNDVFDHKKLEYTTVRNVVSGGWTNISKQYSTKASGYRVSGSGKALSIVGVDDVEDKTTEGFNVVFDQYELRTRNKIETLAVVPVPSYAVKRTPRIRVKSISLSFVVWLSLAYEDRHPEYTDHNALGADFIIRVFRIARSTLRTRALGLSTGVTWPTSANDCSAKDDLSLVAEVTGASVRGLSGHVHYDGINDLSPGSYFLVTGVGDTVEDFPVSTYNTDKVSSIDGINSLQVIASIGEAELVNTPLAPDDLLIVTVGGTEAMTGPWVGDSEGAGIGTGLPGGSPEERRFVNSIFPVLGARHITEFEAEWL